jgi:hypothetical protein
MGETTSSSLFGRVLFFFGKKRADAAERARAQKRKEIQDQIDIAQIKLREKLDALERTLENRSSWIRDV